jgi:peptidoglycan/LPS O-acetylase OafA/YrhL
METLQSVVLVVHFLGWAALFGGLVAQLRSTEKAITAPIRDGIGTAVLAGVALVGFLEAGDDPVNHAKVAVKLTVGLVVLVLVMMNARKPSIPDGMFWTILGLTVANVGVAVLW